MTIRDSSLIALSPSEHEWLTAKWALIRKSQAVADKASNDWNRINDEIVSFLDRARITDVVQRARRKQESLALQDAYDVGSWHSRNAQRHIDDVQLFLQLKILELL